MHFKEGITIQETDDGLVAVINTLVGVVGHEMGTIIRMEFDKTLRRARTGGVILDLSVVESLEMSIVGLINGFWRSLRHDGINLVVVCKGKVEEDFRRVRMIPDITTTTSLEEAMEILGITE